MTILGATFTASEWWSRSGACSSDALRRTLTDFVWGGLQASGIDPSDQPVDLDVLVEVKARGGISQDELTNLITFLMVAGYDTSKNIMTLMMYEMTRHPDIYRRCGDDVEYCASIKPLAGPYELQ
jgi:cytochrome P450